MIFLAEEDGPEVKAVDSPEPREAEESTEEQFPSDSQRFRFRFCSKRSIYSRPNLWEITGNASPGGTARSPKREALLVFLGSPLHSSFLFPTLRTVFLLIGDSDLLESK